MLSWGASAAPLHRRLPQATTPAPAPDPAYQTLTHTVVQLRPRIQAGTGQALGPSLTVQPRQPDDQDSPMLSSLPPQVAVVAPPRPPAQPSIEPWTEHRAAGAGWRRWAIGFAVVLVLAGLLFIIGDVLIKRTAFKVLFDGCELSKTLMSGDHPVTTAAPACGPLASPQRPTHSSAGSGLGRPFDLLQNVRILG